MAMTREHTPQELLERMRIVHIENLEYKIKEISQEVNWQIMEIWKNSS